MDATSNLMNLDFRHVLSKLISMTFLFTFLNTISNTRQAESALGILYTLVGMAAVFGNACALYYFLTIDKSMYF